MEFDTQQFMNTLSRHHGDLEAVVYIYIKRECVPDAPASTQ
jgi:hypothetical protein